MIRVVRLVRHRYAPTPSHAYSGLGAEQYGGRWNNVGVAVAYAAATASLSVLETLVRIDRAFAPTDYELVYANIPSDAVLTLGVLPADWRTPGGSHATRQVGDEFAASNRALALAVPSVVVPDEFNYLINPRHLAFSQVLIESRVLPFSFDARLFAA